jgi:hypothetical protein
MSGSKNGEARLKRSFFRRAFSFLRKIHNDVDDLDHENHAVLYRSSMTESNAPEARC